jgi:hypothetical protein
MCDRALTDWLPPVLAGSPEYRLLLECAGQPETDALWESAGRLRDGQFIETMGEDGIARWEGMMRLPPAGDLPPRRERILARARETPLFTEDTLRSVLNGLCGKGRFFTMTDAVNSKVTVRVAPRVPIEAVAAMLLRRLPANMAADLGRFYTAHSHLKGYRHRELAGNTHQSIREMI